MWFTQNDDTIVSMVFAPSTVEKMLNKGNTAIELITDYPFKNKLKYIIKSSPAERFTFKIRIPSWCDNPKVSDNAFIVDDKRMLCATKILQPGDTIIVEFPVKGRFCSWYNQSIAYERGPLVMH